MESRYITNGFFFLSILFSFLFYTGCSDGSNSVDAGSDISTTDNEAPVFTGLSGVRIDLSELSAVLSWSQATDNVTKPDKIRYLICMSEVKGSCISSFSERYSITGGTNYTVTGLTEGREYFFVVRARDEAGNIDTNTVERSAKMIKERDRTPPAFMGLLYANPSSVSSVTLLWDHATDNITASEKIVYSICMSEVAGGCISSFREVVRTGPGVTKHEITGLDKNKKYYFLVHAIDEDGNMEANREERSASPAESLRFVRTYGDASYRWASSFVMNDGGFLICGSGRIGDALDPDILVSMLDIYGNVKWVRAIGGNRGDSCSSIKVSKDGSVFVTGITQSFTQYGDKDLLFAKLGNDGSLLFSKVIYSPLNDLNAQMDIMGDGSIVLTGYTERGNQKYDSFILIFDKDGNIKKNGFLHSDADDYITRLMVKEGVIYLIGYTNPTSATDYDGFVVSLDDNLNISQQRIIGGNGYEQFTSINFDSAGNILLAGQTQTETFGDSLGDIFVVSLKPDFSDTNFVRLYGADKKESVGDIVTYKDGFAIVGDTVPQIGGDGDAVLIIADAQGNSKVKKYYRGIRDDWFSRALSDMDHLYILGGTASMHNETSEVWFLKLKEDGTTGGECSVSFINEWNITEKGIEPDIKNGTFVIQDSDMGIKDVVFNEIEVGAYVDSQCQAQAW